MLAGLRGAGDGGASGRSSSSSAFGAPLRLAVARPDGRGRNRGRGCGGVGRAARKVPVPTRQRMPRTGSNGAWKVAFVQQTLGWSIRGATPASQAVAETRKLARRVHPLDQQATSERGAAKPTARRWCSPGPRPAAAGADGTRQGRLGKVVQVQRRERLADGAERSEHDPEHTQRDDARRGTGTDPPPEIRLVTLPTDEQGRRTCKNYPTARQATLRA